MPQRNMLSAWLALASIRAVTRHSFFQDLAAQWVSAKPRIPRSCFTAPRTRIALALLLANVRTA
jgi:hypothetical protein